MSVEAHLSVLPLFILLYNYKYITTYIFIIKNIKKGDATYNIFYYVVKIKPWLKKLLKYEIK